MEGHFSNMYNIYVYSKSKRLQQYKISHFW